MTNFFYHKLYKYITLSLIVFFSYILQTTPGILSYYDITPVLVLPACICISVYEGEFAGGLFGFFSGLMVDCFSEANFGYSSFFYLILCVAAGLATNHFFRRSTMNIIILCLSSIFINSVINFFFSYVLYSTIGIQSIFYTIIAPQALYSTLFSIPYCYLFKWLHKVFEPDVARE